MADEDLLVQVIRERLRAANLSTRQASLSAGLSHNTLRVVLGGARPTIETCDALDEVLGLPFGTLRLLAGWPIPLERHQYDETWVQTMLEIASSEVRQGVVRYLVAASAVPVAQDLGMPIAVDSHIVFPGGEDMRIPERPER